MGKRRLPPSLTSEQIHEQTLRICNWMAGRFRRQSPDEFNEQPLTFSLRECHMNIKHDKGRSICVLDIQRALERLRVAHVVERAPNPLSGRPGRQPSPRYQCGSIETVQQYLIRHKNRPAA